MATPFEQIISKNRNQFKPVVDFDSNKDSLLPLDFTAANTELRAAILADTDLFSDWVHQKLKKAGAKFGIGGYNEHRTIYSRSTHFNGDEEPRRLHLGLDIWGEVGTPIYNFFPAKVHSFAFNQNFGDYGATIILAYQIAGFSFHVLYGHLNLSAITPLKTGQNIAAGEKIATFGTKEENGFWPPHLHFQVILDMQNYVGDYPGVCSLSERNTYLANCPNPEVILSTTFS